MAFASISKELQFNEFFISFFIANCCTNRIYCLFYLMFVLLDSFYTSLDWILKMHWVQHISFAWMRTYQHLAFLNLWFTLSPPSARIFMMFIIYHERICIVCSNKYTPKFSSQCNGIYYFHLYNFPVDSDSVHSRFENNKQEPNLCVCVFGTQCWRKYWETTVTTKKKNTATNSKWNVYSILKIESHLSIPALARKHTHAHNWGTSCIQHPERILLICSLNMPQTNDCTLLMG